MYLSARLLLNVVDVNNWEYGDVYRLSEGDTPSLYFQLVDLDKDKDIVKNRPVGKRYMPASGATLQVNIQNINDVNSLAKIATQPFANDTSIWKIDILSTDLLKSGTFSLQIALTETLKVTRAFVSNVVNVAPQTASRC
jgi:hypothetical protein